MPLPFSAGQGKGRMNTPPRVSANNEGIVTPSQGLRYRPNGPAGSMRSPENPIYANFSELRKSEVRRILLPCTWVNKGKAKGRDCNYSLSPAFTYR